ncbi:NAD-binding protein [Embleya sp. NBC_00888]|uniref:NAD-binding protein n=1 Tax=Embleya sp. NBC_00888 TaxID=2975960 RepID=UPI003870A68A|nr:NAD-binding protein [Embleya sp. NBC_00888]
MSTPAHHLTPPPRAGHLVVCGDDALAQRLSYELAHVYGEHVTVLLPSVHRNHGPQIDDLARGGGLSVSVVEAAEPDDDALRSAGVSGAMALALVYRDDRANIHAALRARRINPNIRLVVRLYNRKLGRHLEELLDRAVVARIGDLSARDVTTTVLSDADTATPALVAAAISGAGKVVQADGLLLRAAERPADERDPASYLYTLALASDGVGGSPELLPDDGAVAAAGRTRGRTVLETITLEEGGGAPVNRPRLPQGLPVATLFPPRLRYAIFGLVALLFVFAGLTWWVTGDPPLRAAYRSILDVFGMGDPAIGEGTGRQVLQVLSGLAGMALMPVLFAVVLESLGTFRTATTQRPPPRAIANHVVLLGLGKIGTRVLDRLCDLGIPVVCVERDPQALGIATAHARRVPVVIGDVTREGVLEAAHIGTSRVLLALTSDDAINLEAALYAREVDPELRVAMRLFDDDFAKMVNRTLRESYPNALTRSRSVSSLSAPAFAGAVMGRQILGAIPVEREVLLFAAIDVAGHPELQGQTVAEAFRAGLWRVLALDVADPAERRADLGRDAAPQRDLQWELHPGYLLRPTDRVVLVTTRQGLAQLLQANRGPTPTH